MKRDNFRTVWRERNGNILLNVNLIYNWVVWSYEQTSTRNSIEIKPLYTMPHVVRV